MGKVKGKRARWREYERRKMQIERKKLKPTEYEIEIQKIARELRL